VPDSTELERWGGGLHPEQLFTEYRRRKAPLVWRMIEAAAIRSDGGQQSLSRLLARLLPSRLNRRPVESSCAAHAGTPTASTSAVAGMHERRPERISSTAALLAACVAQGVRLGASFASEWVYAAKPCPTLRANFAFNQPQHRLELVVISPKPLAAAQIGEFPLVIGWGEHDGADGGVSRTIDKKLSPVDRQQLIEVVISSHRRRRHLKRSRAAVDDADEASSAPWQLLPLLWVRLDPRLELPVRVTWTGRAGEGAWAGMPESMCTAQLLFDRDVPSREAAAAALATFPNPTAVHTLVDVARDRSVYFRVRTAAVAALARLTALVSEGAAAEALVALARELLCDTGGHVLPNDFGDLSEYATFKALVEALGTCRDASGFTPAGAFELLLQLIDENDNESNEFDDGAYVGALLRALATTRCRHPGAKREVVARITRQLRLVSVSFEGRGAGARDGGALCRAALHALCTVEIARARSASTSAPASASASASADTASTPSWRTYWHYEAAGQLPSVRLAAADCLLRLTLLAGPERPDEAAAVRDEAYGAECEFTAGAGREGGTGGTGAVRHEPSHPRPTSVLGLALGLSERRKDEPLEQLWLWQAVLRLLKQAVNSHSEGSQAVSGARAVGEDGLDDEDEARDRRARAAVSYRAGLERERRRLAQRGEAAPIAAASLLWELMGRGSAGHARLRLTLCEVWRLLYGEAQPGCFAFVPQPLGLAQVLPLYEPLHAILARRQASREASRALPVGSLKIQLHMNKMTGGTLTHHVGVDAAAGEPTGLAKVTFRSAIAENEKLEELLPELLRTYRERAERLVSFKNVLAAPAPAPAPAPSATYASRS
jgi:hypothetical protein